MPTKKELEDQMKILKTKIRELTKDLKEATTKSSSDLGDVPEKAFGLFKKDGKYLLAKFNYNPETETVEFDDIEDSSRIPHSRDMATFKFNERVYNEIFSKLEE